jgi:ankyrin repeat protein
VNERDGDGWTPLHFAARYDHPDTVRLLLERGADPNALCRYDDDEPDTPFHVSPLMLAARFVKNVTTAKLLLAAGAQLNAQDKDGYSPLIRATQKDNVVRLLLEKGTDVEARIRYPTDEKPSTTALMLAAQGFGGHSSEIAKLLQEAEQKLKKNEKRPKPKKP